MEKEQAREWAEAQAITFSIDLVEAAKKHLKFLAQVDRNRSLYEDDVLQRAVYRYNACWLPLLAKHSEHPVTNEEALVVPLDCEWIWHCHRLNPLRYRFDCKKLYGRILGNHNVISSFQAKSKNTTEEIWTKMYPEEPYELDLSKPILGDDLKKNSANEKFTDYDLLSAVKRQISFTFQITRPYTTDDLFLQEAAARYKGFLHIVRTNEKKNIKCFCVPTYDIDLMWHTHQLHPISYCKDLSKEVGRVLHHNDTDSDRSPGKPLATGFTEMTRLWKENYGKSYWKAGTLNQGTPPTPVTQVPVKFIAEGKELSALDSWHSPIQFPSIKAVEVLLEFVEVKNLPEGHEGNLVVSFSKKQPDKLYNIKRSLNITSESVEKQVVTFQCEPTGEFLFELMSGSPKKYKLLGTCSLSVEELSDFGSRLSADMWISLEPALGHISSEPILLHVFMSFTLPTPAHRLFKLSRSQPSENAKTHVQILDQYGESDFGLHMSILDDATERTPGLLKEVYCITDEGEKHRVAELVRNHWSIKGSNGSLKLQNNSGSDDSLFELVGYKKVKLFPGRRLDFESKNMKKQTPEQRFLTAVEFSAEFPYGKALALIDFKSQTIKTIEEWIILLGITLVFILSEILRGELVSGTGNVIQGISEMAGVFNSGVVNKVDPSSCLSCGVTIINMVENEEKNGAGAEFSDGECDMGSAHLRNMVKIGVGCADCSSGDCGVDPPKMLAEQEFAGAGCTQCGKCGTKCGSRNLGEPCTIVTDCSEGFIKGNTVTKGVGFADCAKCFSCGVMAGADKGGINDSASPLAEPIMGY